MSNTVTIFETTWIAPATASSWGIPGAEDLLLDRRPLPESTLTTDGIGRWDRFDLTALAQRWLDASTPNNGVLLHQEVSSPFSFFCAASENSDASKWPRLVVSHN